MSKNINVLGKEISIDWKNAAIGIGVGALALGAAFVILKPALVAAPVSILSSFIFSKTSVTGIGYAAGGALAAGGVYAAYRGLRKLLPDFPTLSFG
jgi:hypothetical protein